MPPALRKLPSNKGLEALVVVPKNLPLAGTLIALSERGLDADGNIIAFLIGGKTPGQFGLRRSRRISTSATRCCCHPANFWCWSGNSPGSPASASGSGASPLKSLAPGAVVDGPAIFEADLGHEVDNMEAHRRPRHAGGRHRADAGLRRQFFADPAQSAAAIHADGIVSRGTSRPQAATRRLPGKWFLTVGTVLARL